MRVVLRDGAWAELREQIKYGPARAVREALRGDLIDLDKALIAGYVTDWSFPYPVTELEELDDDQIQAIAVECLEVWQRTHDPKAARTFTRNGENGSSPSSLPELAPSSAERTG